MRKSQEKKKKRKKEKKKKRKKVEGKEANKKEHCLLASRVFDSAYNIQGESLYGFKF